MSVKIHKVLDGPYEDEEGHFLLCLTEDDKGDLLHMEIYFDTMDEAYSLIKYLSNTIEAVEIEEEVIDNV
jgi:hypothetical protein